MLYRSVQIFGKSDSRFNHIVTNLSDKVNLKHTIVQLISDTYIPMKISTHKQTLILEVKVKVGIGMYCKCN